MTMLRKILLGNKNKIFALIFYFIISLIVFRFNFGSVSNFPMGTNALDSYIVIYNLKKYGLDTWFPLTDWGIPNIPSLSPILPIELFIPATIFIRSFEYVSFLLAGMAMYFLSRRFVKNEIAAISAGLFYMIAIETSQFFEGHTGLMLSFAIFPVAFLSIYDIIKKPNVKNAIIVALLFYILFAAGDLGAFYMIVVVSIFEFICLEVRNIIKKDWGISRLKFLILSAFLFVVFNAAWIFQYIFGNRPQFTTNVTTVIAPFNQVVGQPIFYSLVGFIEDNSYSYYFLHNYEYSFIHGYYYLIFLILPLLIFTYVAAKRNMPLILLSISSIPAIIISTGNLYLGLSFFNEFLYSHFPLFNYIPALYRWNFYTDFVYSFILAFIIADSLKVLSNKKIDWNWKRELPFDKTLRNIFSKIRVRKIEAIFVIIIFAFVVFGQNSEVFTEPPGTFSFPYQLTAGYHNLSQNSDSNVLTIPFGAIYCRSNYGGVSQSTEFMSPYFSGHNALMFQAGDPYSLQMDYFVGNGMTYGLTNNITKFLTAANTGYVVTTRYGNWSQSSDAIYNPPVNYHGFQEQIHKGSVIYSGSNMTTFKLSNSGQVYFSSTYYVYFGGSSLLYDILDEPWYNGTSTPLINGSLLNSAQADQIISHSTALVVSPASAYEVTKYLSLASGDSIPIIEIFDYLGMPENSISKRYDPWNASNAYSFNLVNGSTVLPDIPFVRNLTGSGYSQVNVSARVHTGHIFSSSFYAGTHHLYMNSTTSFSNVLTLPWTNMSIVTAGINNHGLYPYKGTVNLQTTDNVSNLIWTFTPDNNTFQYLNFEYGNILNSDYLHFVQKGEPSLNYEFQATLSNGSVSYSSPVINPIEIYNSSANLTQVYFNLYSLNSYAASLGKNVGVERFVVGFPSTGNQDSAILSDFELLNVSGSSGNVFQNVNFGSLELLANTSQMILNATANVLFDTVTLTFNDGTMKMNPSQDTRVAYNQHSPSSYSFDLNAPESGILVFAETYSNQWNLSGINGDHVVVNIGLNGWFINGTGNTIFNASITYSGQVYLYHAMVFEVIFLAISVGLLVIIARKRKRIC
jgi:hypothetical protein